MWEIADFAQAYSSSLVTPLQVAKSILAKIEESQRRNPEDRLFISQHNEDLLTKAQSSTLRY